jgi:hypothetical protein
MRFTLLADGSSDLTLLHILDWLLQQRTTVPFEPQWADLARLPSPPKPLPARIAAALDLYPCDLLFVHRDAEKEPHARRSAEIREALSGFANHPPAVCVVPVRMQEAWLLFDEAALRKAAGRPNGKTPLALPSMKQIEQEPDPKRKLHELLREASGLSGRHHKRFRAEIQVHRLAELIDDFTPLFELLAFQALDEELEAALTALQLGGNHRLTNT